MASKELKYIEFIVSLIDNKINSFEELKKIAYKLKKQKKTKCVM